MLPFRQSLSSTAYVEALDAADGTAKFCMGCRRAFHTCVCHFRSYSYEASATTPRSMLHHKFHGPGSQRTKLQDGMPDAVAARPEPPPYMSPRERFPAEFLPDFEQFVLSLPLGVQMLRDPPEIVARLRADWRRHVVRGLVSEQGGTEAEQEKRRAALYHEHRAGQSSLRPLTVTKDSLFSEVPRSAAPWAPSYDGDIPAWSPKRYDSTHAPGGSTTKSSFVPASAGSRTDGRLPTYGRDVRLCVPNRETLSHNLMASQLQRPSLVVGRRLDTHS